MSTKNDAFWYPRHYKDYQNDTSHLSMLEHGAYTLLLDQYYLTGKPIRANAQAIARQMRCMCKEEVEAVEAVLSQFFELREDGWHNRRANEEILKRTELLEKRRKAASNGGKASQQLVKQVLEQVPSNSSTHTHTHTQTHTQEKKESPKPKPLPEESGGGSLVWQAYSTAYKQRYAVEPVRNAKNNALCKQLVQRLGFDAPNVAAFYVQHSGQFYVMKGHALTLLVADAEKLRTEWATGNKITLSQARQADKTQNTGDIFHKLIAEQGERI